MWPRGSGFQSTVIKKTTVIINGRQCKTTKQIETAVDAAFSAADKAFEAADRAFAEVEKAAKES
jgi:hypothetical protein